VDTRSSTNNSCKDHSHNHSQHAAAAPSAAAASASSSAVSFPQNHSHANHGNHAPCCGAPVRGPQVRVVYTPPTEDELKEASPEAMRTSLETLIRLGGYKDAFEPLLTLILQARPDAHDSVLNALGNDHYSLLHWAAKRCTLWTWWSVDVGYVLLLLSLLS
jgi:hypothetical protein